MDQGELYNTSGERTPVKSLRARFESDAAAGPAPKRDAETAPETTRALRVSYDGDGVRVEVGRGALHAVAVWALLVTACVAYLVALKAKHFQKVQERLDAQHQQSFETLEAIAIKNAELASKKIRKMPILSTLYVFGAHYVACARGVPRRRARDPDGEPPRRRGRSEPDGVVGPTRSRASRSCGPTWPRSSTSSSPCSGASRRRGSSSSGARRAASATPPSGSVPRPPAGAPAPSRRRRHPSPAGMHAREIRTHTKAVARLNAFGTDVLRNTNVAAQRAGKAFGLRFGRGGALPPAPKVAVSGR